MSTPGPNAKPVNLALQGGGAHGAFTWGVLDRLLEDGRVRLDAISGTSAGAMSAAVLADGYMQDGYEGARENLRRFWRAVAENALLNPLQRSPIDVFFGNWSVSRSPALMFMDMFQSTVSPYMFNPLNINPLAEILESVVDFERLRRCDDIKLFISATNVENRARQGVQPPRVALRDGDGVGRAAVPVSRRGGGRQAVLGRRLHGQPVAVPVLRPRGRLRRHRHRADQPRGAARNAEDPRDIMERLREITFNSSLLKELRSVDFINRLMDEGKMAEDGFRRMRIHIVEAPGEVTRWDHPAG